MKARRKGVSRVLLPSLLVVLLSISGCGDFALEEILGLESLNITPETAWISLGSSIELSVSNGTPPYMFSVSSGNGTIVTGINPDEATYTAPGVQGTDVVLVSDSNNLTATASILIVDTSSNPLSIVPGAVTLSTNDVFTFVSQGGIAPYTYSIFSGGGSINPVTGVFFAPGSFGTTVIRVQDADLTARDSTVTTIKALAVVPQIVSVPTNNELQFSASGGTAPYSYSMESGGGAITAAGRYTAPIGVGTDKIRVADSVGRSRIATVTVAPQQPLSLSPSSVILLTGGSFDFETSGGTSPYTYTVFSGSGSINASGSYSAPGSPGVAIIRAQDNVGLTADADIVIVSIGALSISPSVVTVEQSTNFGFSTSGGTPQYSYSIHTGNGSVNSITGEYTAQGIIGPETVRVTDASLNTDDAIVNVAPAAPTNLVVDGFFGGPQDIQLVWTDNATGEDGFRVERKLSGGPFAEIGVLGPNATIYNDGGLTPNVPVSYRVQAFSGMIYSGYSNDDFAIPNP